MYAVFYTAGMLSHLLLGLLLARRMNLPKRLATALSAVYVLAMTVGAKALYDLQHGHFQPAALLSLQHFIEGGMWGGPLVYLGLSVLISLALWRNRWATLDLAVLSLPVPLMLSKLACFCQGCCHGRACPWPWALTFPQGGSAPAGTPIHPTQLYEIAVLALILFLLLRLNRDRWRGTLLAWFLLLYGSGRALTEIWRGDLQERLSLGPLSHSQWLCVAAAAVSAGILLIRARRRRSATFSAEAAEAEPTREDDVPQASAG